MIISFSVLGNRANVAYDDVEAYCHLNFRICFLGKT